MQPKPTLAVRAPKNPDDFVNSQRLAVEREPLAFGHEPPTAVSERLTATRTKMRGMVRRASGAEVARVTVYLSPDAALKLRRHCFDNALELSEVAGKAVERYVAKL